MLKIVAVVFAKCEIFATAERCFNPLGRAPPTVSRLLPVNPPNGIHDHCVHIVEDIELNAQRSNKRHADRLQSRFTEVKWVGRQIAVDFLRNRR